LCGGAAGTGHSGLGIRSVNVSVAGLAGLATDVAGGSGGGCLSFLRWWLRLLRQKQDWREQEESQKNRPEKENPPLLKLSARTHVLGMILHRKNLCAVARLAKAPLQRELRLSDAQLALHLFERYALGLWVEEPDDEELQEHHGREKYERVGTRRGSDSWEGQRNYAVHEPVRKTA
jgi:uncharacterized protein YigA (DUF484 family)